MSDFVERLPWRLAALAGLLIGAAGLLAGTDLWVSLLRVGAAGVVFGGLGVGLRALLRHGATPPKPGAKPAAPAPSPTNQGAHVDEKTPEMTVDDL